MPISLCFSYPSDVSPGAGSSGAPLPDLPGLRRTPYTACFTYPATACFTYPPDVLPDAGKRDEAPPAPRRMPAATCFRY